MAHWQKQLVIGVNIALLFIFLDVTLLIFIRSINGDGVYQTDQMKWLTFLVWVFIYAFVWMCQGIAYILFKQVKQLKKSEQKHYI